jgi:hypothetical protein
MGAAASMSVKAEDDEEEFPLEHTHLGGSVSHQ